MTNEQKFEEVFGFKIVPDKSKRNAWHFEAVNGDKLPVPWAWWALEYQETLDTEEKFCARGYSVTSPYKGWICDLMCDKCKANKKLPYGGLLGGNNGKI